MVIGERILTANDVTHSFNRSGVEDYLGKAPERKRGVFVWCVGVCVCVCVCVCVMHVCVMHCVSECV